ncbi:glycoside hydrolase family 20 zincin-like fold domain-containing protein [Salinibius halmophilus]|uniref:glycoside hydrolase family 20 zincin-like fold domain-containing protein n=1 Tax=Salinibius halmophilus TaxID=1853216 RepID=UPI000E671FD9|nr:glycoside hydrolase family 20 zincin-like fold domain-containing protein [Salinibius halmophilus]
MQLVPPVKRVTWLNDSCQVDLSEYNTLAFHDPLPSESYQDDSLPQQGYRIELTGQRLVVHYKDALGRWYAVQTLKQLAEQKALQAGVIEDWPDIPVRGVLLDISRDRVPTMNKLYELLSMWASLKYNQVQLYMEAAFAYQGEEAAWQGRSPITASELDQIQRWCDELGLELVANQATFGHMENWLDKPEYQHLAENIGGCYDGAGNFRNHSFCLSAVNPQAKAFVERLFDELLPHVNSPWVNVNCDETFDLGVGDSAQACAERGKGRVYLDYVLAINEMLAKRGKRMMLWGDILLNYPELVGELPKNAIALNWGYEAGHDWQGSCGVLQKAGIEHYVVAGTATFASVTGRWLNARTNIDEAIAAVHEFSASGFYVSEWGDFGHTQPWVAGYPGYVYAASKAWHQDADINIEQALEGFMPNDCVAPLLLLANSYLATQTADQLPGVGIYGALLCNQMTNRHMKKVKHWSVDGFALAQQQCRSALNALQNAQTSLVQQEVLLTAKLAVFACQLGQELAKQGDYRIERLPEAMRQALAQHLAPLLPEFEKTWLQESRAGGLDDSLARLEFLHNKLAS